MTTPKLAGIEACVFDAYGTLFDVNSAARSAQDSLLRSGNLWPSCGARSNCNTPGCAASLGAMRISGR
jgi:hypothetical protein